MLSRIQQAQWKIASETINLELMCFLCEGYLTGSEEVASFLEDEMETTALERKVSAGDEHPVS